MNQFTPNLLLVGNYEPYPLEITEGKQVFFKKLRVLAAHFKMHYALVHKIGHEFSELKSTTYVTTLRNLDSSNCTLGDLVQPSALRALISGSQPVFWRRTVPLSGVNSSLLDSLNISSGVSVPFHNALGNHTALTLCDIHPLEINPQDLTHFALPLLEAITRDQRIRVGASLCLSSRETDCLQWAAAGKTSLETSIILGLSPHTINQYLAKATEKLGAVNRTHAVSKAIQLGLIDLSSV